MICRVVISTLCLALGSCGAPRTPAAPASDAANDPSLAQAVALLARAKPLSKDEAERFASFRLRGQAGVEQYVDYLLADDAVGVRVAPSLIVQHMTNFIGHVQRLEGYILKKANAGGQDIYYLRKPCAATEAERVHPWWDLDSEVLVCPDSHRPTVFRSQAPQASGMALRCWAQFADPAFEWSPTCGCGPNLVRCHPSRDHFLTVQRSFGNEVTQTVAHVVNHDMPLSALWTANETFRDRNAEFAYRHGLIEEGRQADLDTLAQWPVEGKWARRVELAPGQHAGLATTTQFIGYAADARSRVSLINDKMWCVPSDSAGSTAAAVLAIPSRDLQIRPGVSDTVAADWEYLPRRQICTNCHARLDFGVRFFNGYPDGRGASIYFVPELQLTGVGELYHHNIKDPRGKASLNPHSFAELAVKQPEFASCMVSNVASHVFGATRSEQDTAALAAAFERRPTFKSILRAALIRYALAGSSSASEAPMPEFAGPPAPEVNGMIALPSGVRHALDAHCMHCHAENKPNLGGKALPRQLLLTALEQVAYERMPKNKTLPAADRRTFLRDIIALAHRSPTDRIAAWNHLTNGQRAIEAPALSIALDIVGDLATGAGGHATPLSAFEFMVRPAQQHYSLGFIASTSLAALQHCRTDRARDESLEDCVRRATEPSALSGDKLAH